MPAPIPLQELLTIALLNRPELEDQQAAIRQALLRWKGPKCCPFRRPSSWATATEPRRAAAISWPHRPDRIHLPPGRRALAASTSAADLDAALFWTLQNLGVGNLAQIKMARSNLASANLELVRQLNDVRAEVAVAYARIRARLVQIEICEQAVKTITAGYAQDFRQDSRRRGTADRADEQPAVCCAKRGWRISTRSWITTRRRWTCTWPWDNRRQMFWPAPFRRTRNNSGDPGHALRFLDNFRPRPPRSHAPRGNARSAAPRPGRSQDSLDTCPTFPRAAERRRARSHAERGNEEGVAVMALFQLRLRRLLPRCGQRPLRSAGGGTKMSRSSTWPARSSWPASKTATSCWPGNAWSSPWPGVNWRRRSSCPASMPASTMMPTPVLCSSPPATFSASTAMRSTSAPAPTPSPPARSTFPASFMT